MLSSYSNNGFSPSANVLTSTILKLSINPSLHSEYPFSNPGSPIPCVARLSNILCNFLLTILRRSLLLYARNKHQNRKISHGQIFAYVLFSCIVVIYVVRQYHGSQFTCLHFVMLYILCLILFFFIHSKIKGCDEVNIIRHILRTCLYHYKIYNFILRSKGNKKIRRLWTINCENNTENFSSTRFRKR